MMRNPKRIGKYALLEEIGRGGFAVVYKARDIELERLVALKVLHPYWSEDPGFAARFRREARAAANLRHSNIVTVYDAGEAEGQLYIAMEYLPGETMRKLLETEGALPLERALPILEQVASALDYAHRQGVIHRDVKPNNVMLEEGVQVKTHVTLMDFGLVKAMESEGGLTSLGTVLGSPEYMAPEQADFDRRDEIGPATDRYALGIVAYEMLTGRVPFPGNTPSTLVAHMQKSPPDPRSIREGLPASVVQVLLKSLSKAPRGRYPSAMAMVEALAKAEREPPLAEGLLAEVREPPLAEGLPTEVRESPLAEGLPTEAREPPLAEGLPTEAKRKPWQLLPTWAWIGAGVVILALMVGVWLMTSQLPGAGNTRTRQADGVVMVYVPAGEFLMGSAENDESASSDERPQHTVYLDAFWIDRTEVTNAQYNECVEAGECDESGSSQAGGHAGDDQPVAGVDWYNAMAYCEWVGATLPTEAQWEKAARGPSTGSGEGQIYPWGEEKATCDYAVTDEGKGNGCGEGAPWPVGSKPKGASPYGALDMAGNVWEWVADWYGDYSAERQVNPTGPETGTQKIVRGGSYAGDDWGLRVTTRHPFEPDWVSNEKGFRCVVVP